MELDAVDRVFAVTDAHNFAVVYGFGGDFEAIRDRAAFARQ